ncbi:MAG: hypothetical protein K5895_13585 [Lachnospiraceae bacterium]|nr:hypothetical protein [Lachnospiraceae bacterium]
MARKKILSWALVAMMATSSLWSDNPYLMKDLVAAQNANSTEEDVTVDEQQVNAADYGLCDNVKDGAILHAFCWSFNTIKQNMADIAEAGYTTVQTSPANACNDSHPQMKLFTDEGGSGGCWWWHYQPTDWTIGNYQLGTEDDYKAMCAEADKYGVKIITDVIPNHTTPDRSRVAQSLYDAAGGKDALYHANGFNAITQWGNRKECTTGMMGGLPDVDTENTGFQEYYIKYCNQLIADGCDGFRYDTAKHIGVPSDPKDDKNTRGKNDFWPVAVGQQAVDGTSTKLSDPSKLFIYGEVLQGDNVPTEEYAKYIDQTASSYGGKLRGAIGSNNFEVGNISDWCHSNPDKIVTWVESHDTYCNDHESGWMSDWQIRACWAIITARKQGTPLFMSRPDGSNGSSGNYWGNNVLGAKGNNQFKDPEVVACNHFRNAMVGESEYMSNPTGSSSLLVIERGTKGAVIINLGSQVSNVKLSKMADGTYTEEVSGSTVQVSGGTLNFDVKGGSIAVVYDASATASKAAKISASKATGSTFTSPFDLTLSVRNAESATYKTSDGQEGSISSSTKVTIGEKASVGDTITVTVTAKGSDGETVTETYKYTMADAPSYPTDATFMILAKKSDFSSAPFLYIYEDKKALNGDWPGAKMEDFNDDYYIFYTSKFSKGTVILSCDGWRSTPDQQPGIDVSGLVEFDKSSSSFSKVDVSTKTTAPTKTDAPVVTKVPDKTTAPSANETITVSKASGESFTSENMDVTITLSGTSEGSYSVDNGPEKSFKSKATVTLGEGKIADTDVTLKVKAGSETKTFTYKKVFDESKANVKSAALRIQSIMDIVAEAAQVSADAESKGFYRTNPSKNVGKEATIKIDGDFSDWSEDMLIAQGAAWDIANNFKGGHENCVLDDYALYGAWDNDNLYIGWQMVNTTDTWANPGDGPLSDDGRVLDVPLMLALNVGNRPAMTGKMANGKLLWDALMVNFETRVDNILLMSGKVGLGTPGYFIAADESGGASYDKEYCLSFKDEGIDYKMAKGCLAKKIMMLEGASSTDDVYDTDKYVDAMTKNHDTNYDSFYEINIPLKTLGIDKKYLEENGIGVMQIATRGQSGIDCIPHDPCMLDNALGECAVDPSTSHEKDDEDIITVPLAAVGSTKAIGNGGGGSLANIENSGGSTTKATTVPTATEKASDTKATEKPSTSDSATAKPTTSGDLTVNFGADRSSPQYNTTALTLKAIAYGGAKSYSYEFYVDGEVVQKSSSTDYFKWTGSAGSHKIKVIVEDSDGKKVSCEKNFVLEKNGSATDVPSTSNGELKLTYKNSAGKSQYVKKAIEFEMDATGGTGKYTYTITAKSSASNAKTIVLLHSSESNSCTWTPTKAGKYAITYCVKDSNNNVIVEKETITIKAIDVLKFTSSKTSVKKGQKIKFTMNAKSVECKASKLKYKLYAKLGKKTVLIRNFSKSKTYTWKTKKKGTYKVYLVVKDTSGNTKTVKLSKTIKVK